MADSLGAVTLLVILVSAFALPLVFLVWIRNTERWGREPWHALLKAFAWGAVFSVLIAIAASLLLLALFQESGPLYRFLSQRFANPELVFGVLVIAPFVEEAAKGLGASAGRRFVRFPADGLVYGAAAGLGFSATENLFYGLSSVGALGASGSLLLIAVRSFSSSLLHASSTAVTGYGLAKGWLSLRRFAFVPFYLLAVSMHATFNFLASFGELYALQVGEIGYALGFIAAVVFAVVAVSIIRLKLARPRPAVP